MSDHIVRFTHWPGSGDWVFDPKRTYTHDGNFFKPVGFWLSDDSNNDGWPAWCKAESFHDCLFGFEVKVDTSKMMVLYSYAQMPQKYKRPSYPNGPLKDVNWSKIMADGFTGVWVRDYWDGPGRYDEMWWYSWDCDSAVVWDLSAIISVKKLKERVNK